MSHRGEQLSIGEVPSSLVSGAEVYMAASARQLAVMYQEGLHELGSNFVFLTGSGNPRLANDVVQLLGRKLYYAVRRFPASADNLSEPEVLGEVPVRTDGKDIIIFQSMGQAVNTELMEVFVMLDALKRMKKGEVTVVLSYMGYGRAEKKDRPGRSITARLVADLLQTAGANRVLTCDLHDDAEVGFFNIPVDQLYASYVLIPYIKELIATRNLNYKGAASDEGSYKRNAAWSRRINGDEEIVTFKKERDKDTGITRIVGCQGDIMDYDLVISDDIYASGGTLDDCARYAKDHGAKSVRGVVTHALFTGDAKTGRTALQVLDDSPLDEIIVTDTIDIPEEIRKHPKVTVLSIAPLLAEAVYRNIIGESLSELVD